MLCKVSLWTFKHVLYIIQQVQIENIQVFLERSVYIVLNFLSWDNIYAVMTLVYLFSNDSRLFAWTSLGLFYSDIQIPHYDLEEYYEYHP